MTINANDIQRNAQDNSLEAAQPLLNDLTAVQPIHPNDGDPIAIQPMPLENAGEYDMTPVQPIYPGDDYGNDHSTQPVDQISPEPKPFWPGEGSDLSPVQPIYPGDSDLTPVQPIYPGDDFGNDHSTQPVDQISPEPKPFWPGEGSDLSPVQPIYPGDGDLTPVQPIYPGDEGPIAVQPIYPVDGDLTPVQPVMPDWHCGTVENGTAFGNDTIALHTTATSGMDGQWWLEGGDGQADVLPDADDGYGSASGLGLESHDGITGFGAAEAAAYESLTQDLIV